MMSEDTRKFCVICAWRAHCAKRFSMGDDTTLHCPDFTEDITLRKVRGNEPCAIAEDEQT